MSSLPADTRGEIARWRSCKTTLLRPYASLRGAPQGTRVPGPFPDERCRTGPQGAPKVPLVRHMSPDSGPRVRDAIQRLVHAQAEYDDGQARLRLAQSASDVDAVNEAQRLIGEARMHLAAAGHALAQARSQASTGGSRPR